MFSVCLSGHNRGGGGYLLLPLKIFPTTDPMSFLGVPQSLVPCPFQEGTLVLGGKEYPSSRQGAQSCPGGTPGQGYPSARTRLGCPPPSHHKTGVVPPARSVLGYPTQNSRACINAGGLSCFGLFREGPI